MQAIETFYNGYRFRSRLEARWAYFFDQCNIPYFYEPEGYVMNDGSTYLPDFYLPDCDTFFEVKGVMSNKDYDKMASFAQESNKDIVVGNPNMHFYFFNNSEGDGYGDDYISGKKLKPKNFLESEYETRLNICRKCGKFYFCTEWGSWGCRCCNYYDGDHSFIKYINGDILHGLDGEDIRDRISYALSARFEHGEKPKRNWYLDEVPF